MSDRIPLTTPLRDCPLLDCTVSVSFQAQRKEVNIHERVQNTLTFITRPLFSSSQKLKEAKIITLIFK